MKNNFKYQVLSIVTISGIIFQLAINLITATLGVSFIRRSKLINSWRKDRSAMSHRSDFTVYDAPSMSNWAMMFHKIKVQLTLRDEICSF